MMQPDSNIAIPQLEPDSIPLYGGLDFTTNKLQVDKGSLLDCLNYEVVDKLGYQEVSGFVRFDGRISPDQLEFFYFKYALPGTGPVAGFQFSVGGEIIGVCVDTFTVDSGANQLVVYARVSADSSVATGNVIVPIISATTTYPGVTAITNSAPYSEYTANLSTQDAEGLYDRLATLNDELKDRITDLHSTPIGLHWYRDKLYAVVNEVQLAFESGGTTEITPNMVMWDSNAYAARILHVEVTSGAWGTGDASGTMLIEPLDFTYFGTEQNSGNYPPPDSGTIKIWDNEVDQNVLIADALTARELSSSDSQPQYATLWRSKSETNLSTKESVIGYGWERISPGWEVDFIDGFSDTGSFRKIERSISNNFTYDTGNTSTLPDGFQHGAVISNLVPSTVGSFSSAAGLISEGYTGWRDSTSGASPKAFVSDTTSIATNDTDYIFGDVWGRIKTASNGGIPYMNPSGEDGVYDAANTFFDPSVPVISDARIANGRAPLLFYNFGTLFADIDADAVITGIKITTNQDVKCQYDGGVPDDFSGSTEDYLVPAVGGSVRLYAAILQYNEDDGTFQYRGGLRSASAGVSIDPADWTVSTGAASGGQFPVEGTFTDTGVVTEIGGEFDTFSLDDITLEKLSNGEYALAFFARTDGYTPAGYSGTWNTFTNVDFTARVQLDHLQISVYYTEPSARYYITDDASTATNVISADLVSYVTTSGSIANRTGAGKMQFTNIQPAAGTKTTILKGDTIHPDLLSISTATILAKVDDNAGADTGDVGMVLNGLPTRQDLIDEASRYQFITANFYAKDDWDGFYGVSGAGKAFSFGEFVPEEAEGLQQYITKITTNTITDEDDKPRHIAFHSYALALGFRDGVVRFSVPGEPENFSGTEGAAEIGVGDKVTGLLPLVGTTLAVYCENSIHSIVGTDAESFQAQVLVPESGAIEYTAVNIGGIPIHCDTNGITTLEQSQKYGNFQGFRQSAKISPWVIPRMTRDLDLFSLNQGAGVVCAIPVRSKNQYRLFFRDGRVLVMTINADGSNAFTFSQYYLGSGTDGYFVPFAHSSQIDENGRERIHMSHYSPHSTANSNYVYEFDRGWSFDGNWFPAYFTTNWFFRNPFQVTTVNKVRVDGLTRGLGYGRITVGKDYDEDSYTINDQDISLPFSPASTMWADYRAKDAMSNVAKSGRSLSFKVFKDEGETIIHPPVCYQVLLVQYRQGGKGDA